MSTPLPASVPLRRATDRPQTRHTVTLVVPAHNEARNIPWVFEQIPCSVDEVLLVDGRSADATARMAALCRPSVRISCTSPAAARATPCAPASGPRAATTW